MDRLEAMALLVAAVESGSLSAAGRKLNVPLPTISRKISDLEARLGTRLLIRQTRRLALTDAGAAYVEASKRILDEVRDAERTAAGEYSAPRGDLVLAAPLLFGRLHVLPVVTDFLARHPDINIRLVLSDRNAHLVDDRVDMAVRIGALPDSSLTTTRVGSVRYVLCASPAYLAAHGVPKIPADVSTLDCISHDFIAPSLSWPFRKPGAKPGAKRDIMVPIRVRLSVTTAEAAIDAAIAGTGVTRLLSYQPAAAVARGDLRIILAAFEREPLPVSLLHAGRGVLPLKMRSFLDFAAPRLRAALAGEAQPARIVGR
jgi:DNA-binding transcriptional LysR family regulator